VLLGCLRTGWLDRHGLHLEPSELRSRQTPIDPLQIKIPGKVTEYRDALLMNRPESVAHIEAAIYPGSAFADNWYHWILEVLPRVWLSHLLPQHLADLPILIPERVLRMENHRESLSRIIDLDRVVPIDTWSLTTVERLIWIDGMFDMPHLAPAVAGPIPSRFHREGMRDYRDALLRQDPGHRLDKVPERIFLDRGEYQRGFNRDEVLDVTRSHGFTPILPHELSFAEQMSIFQGSRFIIGPTGGAWTGLLFAGPDQVGLYWIPDKHAGSGLWSSLAAIGGSEVFELTHPAGDDSGSYRLEPEALDAAIISLTA